MIHVINKKTVLICGLALSLMGGVVYSESHYTYTCTSNNSFDSFKVYPSQLTYASEDFAHFQLINGLTILVVNLKTMRFNRLSNLNLLKHSTLDPNLSPEQYQFFSGSCQIEHLENK